LFFVFILWRSAITRRTAQRARIRWTSCSISPVILAGLGAFDRGGHLGFGLRPLIKPPKHVDYLNQAPDSELGGGAGERNLSNAL